MFTGTLWDFSRRHATTILPYLSIRKALNVSAAVVEYCLGRMSLFSRPFVYRVDPSTACNLRCPGCEAHTQQTDELRLLTLPVFEKILNGIRRHGIRLSLYDSGEPLVNPNVFEMVSRGNSAGMSTMINTNMTLFRKDHIPALADSGLTVLSASVDGYTQADYGKYRRRGRVKDVLEALRSVVALKRQTGKGPLLEVQVIDLKHLRSKKREIIEFFKNLGVDRVIWKRESWGYNGEHLHSNRKRCFWLYTGAMIRPDGKVYPCSGLGFGRLAYGDLTEESIDDIWNNRFYQFSRTLFTKGPDLPYSEEMHRVPCLNCNRFKITRKMLPKPKMDSDLELVHLDS